MWARHSSRRAILPDLVFLSDLLSSIMLLALVDAFVKPQAAYSKRGVGFFGRSSRRNRYRLTKLSRKTMNCIKKPKHPQNANATRPIIGEYSKLAHEATRNAPVGKDWVPNDAAVPIIFGQNEIASQPSRNHRRSPSALKRRAAAVA